MSPGETEAALALARAQLARLAAGDLDGFLLFEAEYAAACRAVAGAPIAGPGAQEGLEELIRVTSAISAELQRLMGDTASRLVALNERRRAAGAYLAAPAADHITHRHA